MKQKQDNIKLTIFTPAYNRAHTLKRTYDSLMQQTCKEFIWLIVDDGSRDNTKEMVHGWQNLDNGFEIQYIYKENGGMHTAHNVAYFNISTELNVCIDSDDWLPLSAVKDILDKWEAVRGQGYAGIIGLDVDTKGKVIGTGFDENIIDTTVSGYYDNGGSGDKKLVYRTDIIKKYPEYPVFENEKYVSLSYKYLLIDQDYKMATLNVPLCIVDYQEDGSSNTMFKQYVRNPKGFAFWRTVRMKYDKKKSRLIMDCIHYVSSSIFAGNKRFIKESPYKILTIMCTIPGVFLNRYIKLKNKKI